MLNKHTKVVDVVDFGDEEDGMRDDEEYDDENKDFEGDDSQ